MAGTAAFDKLDRGGLALAVDMAGEGPAFVLQHGLCGDAGQAAMAMPPSVPLRRVTLECRAHGSSPVGPVDALTLASFTDDVAALIEALGEGPVVLGGISMGAAIAMRLAVVRPDLVRALALIRPAWLDVPAPANLRANREVAGLLATHDAATARQLFEASDTAARLAVESPDNLVTLRGLFTREPLAATADLIARIASDGPDVTLRDIASITVPTLVVGTLADEIHPLSHAQRLADLIVDADYVEITPKGVDATAHWQQLQAAIADFVAGLPTAPAA